VTKLRHWFDVGVGAVATGIVVRSVVLYQTMVP
jgi:hypothetical protein